MSALQKLLAAKKGSANEQVSSGKTVQPETVAPKAPETPPVGTTKKPSILEQLKSKKANGSGTGIHAQHGTPVVEQRPIEGLKNEQASTVNKSDVGSTNGVQVQTAETQEQKPNTETVTEASPKVTAEEVMPAGLSAMQKLKWKREHPNASKPENVNAVASSSNPQNTIRKEETVSSPERPAVSQQVQTLSASQSADASKQNDGNADVEELKSNLNYLANNIENPELVKNIVRTIAMQVANHPEIQKYMTRGEVNLMVRGLRQSYQVSAMKKQDKAETKKKADKGVDELAAMFKDAGISFKF